MEPNISPIIQASRLNQILDSSDLIIVDARGGVNAKECYERNHINGAHFIDWENELADIKMDVSKGGRHPLPNVHNFAKTISRLGIRTSSHVVVYDDKNGANSAARFWWMMKSLGHDRVQVLNGGIQEAQKHNIPTNSSPVSNMMAESYPATDWKLPLSDINEVETVSEKDDYVVIDVRESGRYQGEFEPLDLVAGHIPGAINIPFAENLQEDGLFKSPQDLKEKYEELFQKYSPENIIVHCGSGVTTCHTLLAMDYAGFTIPKLFVGSWSEWSRNGKQIEKG